MLRHVLIVDDHESVRRGLCSAFEAVGFQCTAAEHGAQAVKIVEDLTPDIIVLDVSMPVMNGLDAAPLLRKKLPRTPIIMLSMFTSDLLMEVSLAAGATACVSKGESVARLVKVANALLDGHSFPDAVA